MREHPDLLRGVGGLTLALVAGLTVAACSTADNGSATPAPTSGNAPAQQGGQAAITLPQRPRDLPLTHIDPCTLLSKSQQSSLGIDPGVPGHPDVNWHDPQCGFQLANNADVLGSYNVQTVTATGIQFWLNTNLADNIKQVSVAGFPGVDLTSRASTANSCQTVVSVADGQMLIVQFDFPPTGQTATQSCADTEQVAAAAVTTLQTAN